MSDELRDNRRSHSPISGLSRKGVDKKLHNRRAKRALARETKKALRALLSRRSESACAWGYE
ncbi:MAG: hypothetical protein IT381_14165 [Deltaproteobacteria bacterium]|nr:hypothetical protein [Deltaproteobacteria bacterium]